MRTPALALLALALGVPAYADTMYEYTGNPFTIWKGDICEGDCRLTVTLTLPGVLPANMVQTANVTLPILAFSIGDGHNINQAPGSHPMIGSSSMPPMRAGFRPSGASPRSSASGSRTPRGSPRR